MVGKQRTDDQSGRSGNTLACDLSLSDRSFDGNWVGNDFNGRTWAQARLTQANAKRVMTSAWTFTYRVLQNPHTFESGEGVLPTSPDLPIH
ncbi:MAG: hypothetical protein ACE361_27040 [Aureliella sp.]